MQRSPPTEQGRPATAFLGGGGILGELTRAHDWSRTPVGPPEQWPQSLKTAIRIMLDSRYPMFVWWGPELINFYNDGYISVLGQRHPHALGCSAPQLWSDIWDTVGPQADIVIREGRATWNEELLLVMERNGFLEETYFTFSYSPLLGDDGGIGGVFCACIEDTQRVISQRRLRLLSALAEQASHAKSVEQAYATAAATLAAHPHDVPFALLYRLEDDGVTARLTGRAGVADDSPAGVDTVRIDDPAALWPLASVLQTGCALHLDRLPADAGPLPGGAWPEPCEQAVILPLAKSGQAALAGFLIIGVSPRLAFTDDYNAFLELLSGHIATAVANAKAYAEERRRAEALTELDRAKTAFFSNVSHEFRTPLTLMLGPLESLLQEENLTPALRGQLDLIHRNGRRLLRLVNTLLQFSRIEAGRVNAVYEATDLAALTAALSSNFRSACERAGLTLHVDCPPLTEPVYVDREMWEKIVLNLLSNAFKFTFAGAIDVTLRQCDAGVELRVRDTGIGIPPEEMPRLFERFHRVQNARSRTHEGSGIGLALVQELLRLHGGSIRAESAPERGTTFIATVPLGSAHLSPEQVRAESTPAVMTASAEPFIEEALSWLPGDVPPADVQPALVLDDATTLDDREEALTAAAQARVLIVDDNSDMRAYLNRLLAGNFQIETVGDGIAALRSARAQPPALVLTDVMLPGLDGLGLTRALRVDPRTRDIPIIMLSARAGEEHRIEGLQAGADDYLVKPFSARELRARIAAHIEMARLRGEWTAALRTSEERFRIMADTAPAMLWVSDASGTCVFLSRAWCDYTGQDEESALKFGWLDAVHPDDRAASARLFLAATARQEPFALDYRVRRHDGEYRWMVDAGRPRFGDDGAFLGFVGSVVDVHGRKQMENALRQADQRKDEFLATLAHELRNPLAPLQTGIELLRLRGAAALAEPKHRNPLTMMDRQLRHLVRLVDELLDVSRITRGKVQLCKERIDLAQAIRRAVEDCAGSLQFGQRHISCDLPDEPLPIDADPVRIAQTIANLLHNAVKYTDAGGHIRVRAEADNGCARLIVADDGIGIAPELLDELFEIFVQVDSHRAGGLGIGLTLVKNLVELHGGHVRAHSLGEGCGSEFTVELPLAAPLPMTLRREGGQPPSPADGDAAQREDMTGSCAAKM